MLNLNKKLEAMDRKRSVSRKRSKGKRILRIFVILLVILLLSLIPTFQIYQAAKDAGKHGKALSEGYKNQNLDQMIKETVGVRSSLQAIDSWSVFLMWTTIIPIAGGYYQDLRGFTKAGIEELRAAEVILKGLEPSKAELGLTGQPQAGTDKVSQGIKILEKSLPNLDKVAPNFKKASAHVKNIDVNKYPENINGKPLKQYLTMAKNFIIGADIALRDARAALEIAPTALGQNGEKNYLLLFQNDKEIRSTGGFLTAYATLNANKGKIAPTGSDDIYRLDERLIEVCNKKICGDVKPPAQIVKYLPEADGRLRGTWSMRDSNTSPDVETSIKNFERLYKLLGQGISFDGIILIDTQVVEELIAVTGPIEVEGTRYSAEIDKRCNCPGVIYELERYAEVAAKGQEDRKAVLGVLMQEMLKKLLEADVEKIPMFVETVVRLANHKHIIFYMYDQKSQDALAKLNWTGKIKDYDGDYLHINDNNFAGGKSNLYLDQKVTQEIKKSGDKITKKITIDYKNTQKHDIWLNGINRNYVRFYVPLGSKLTFSKGSDNPVTTIENDLGKTVFEAFVVTRPDNSRKLEIEYEIPYQPKGEYKMLIQKQPGAKDFQYVIKSGSSTKADFKLEMDKEINFGI
jgi:hypothetical protein